MLRALGLVTAVAVSRETLMSCCGSGILPGIRIDGVAVLPNAGYSIGRLQ